MSPVRKGPVQVAPLHIHSDSRGGFVEVFRKEWFPGFEAKQVNISYSRKGVLRGLHYHTHQTDVWWPILGRFQVAFVKHGGFFGTLAKPVGDIVESFLLDSREPISILIPPNVAHGYLALEQDCILGYAVNREYDPADEHNTPWNHPGIEWMEEDPILSERDTLKGDPDVLKK